MLNGNVVLVSFPAQLLVFHMSAMRHETRDDVIKIKHNQSRNSFKALRIRNNFDDKTNSKNIAMSFILSLLP